jgi:iron complex transport system substrate-binding protein
MQVNVRQMIWMGLLMAVFIQVMASQSIAKTVTDRLGRQVSLPDSPQRIVSLAPNITEIIFAIGQQRRLRGVTRFSDYPVEAAKLPKVGSYVQPDLERIVALNPDLCLATKDGNPKRVIDRLQSLNIPVYAVNPRNLNMVMETILDIGGLLEASERAETLVESMHQRIEQVKSLVGRTRSRPRVFFQIGISPIVSSGADTFIHELITLAGGKNVVAANFAYPRFSREQVLAFAPEVFIITSMAREGAFEKVKAGWSRWPNMPAVRDQRIHLVDSDVFDRPSPRLIEALELLVRLIHPELFEETR